VAICAEYAASLTALDLNIVTQTSDLPEGQGFDLVVATNILVYYDVFQQALAMSNIARLLNPNGIFIANNALPAAHDSRLKYLGRKNVVFAKDGSYGDDVVVYQRQ
jgi:chemotaxis methyl-accepting protein methylase